MPFLFSPLQSQRTSPENLVCEGTEEQNLNPVASADKEKAGKDHVLAIPVLLHWGTIGKLRVFWGICAA